MERRNFLQSAAMAGAYAMAARIGNATGTDAEDGQTITIRPHVVKGPLAHIWEECVGSDRAAVGMREQWLTDLDTVRKQAGMKAVRFHGLFNDEMGTWPGGAKSPNFLYIDTVFDGMIERGLKPFVELSFMPGALASGTRTAFWYRGNTTPPKDMAQWSELVGALASHCVERYGMDEVLSWKFEVWNEPNLGYFWTGAKNDYFELYRTSATALKRIDKALKVGGPATAQAAWVPDFIEFCASQQVPVDFVSTHAYPDDSQKAIFGEDRHYPFEEVLPRALSMVREQIRSSKIPDLPLYLTEWSSQNPAFIAHTIKACNGLADIMSYWTFDAVYEELGVAKTFLNRSFGLIGMRGVPRPSFHTFTLLHRLGKTQLDCGEGAILATRRDDGSLAILVWNLVARRPGQHSSMGDPTSQVTAEDANEGETKRLVLRFESPHKQLKGHITRVERNSGNLKSAYESIGSPAYPTVRQIEELKQRSALAKPESVALNARGEIAINIPANGVALIELA